MAVSAALVPPIVDPAVADDPRPSYTARYPVPTLGEIYVVLESSDEDFTVYVREPENPVAYFSQAYLDVKFQGAWAYNHPFVWTSPEAECHDFDANNGFCVRPVGDAQPLSPVDIEFVPPGQPEIPFWISGKGCIIWVPEEGEPLSYGHETLIISGPFSLGGSCPDGP